jgi:hypothetical protein
MFLVAKFDQSESFMFLSLYVDSNCSWPNHDSISVTGRTLKLYKNKDSRDLPSSCPGGVVQWASQKPRRQQTRVRIPPGYKVFRENMAMLLCVFDLLCIVCVLKNINKIIAPHILKKIFFHQSHQQGHCQ